MPAYGCIRLVYLFKYACLKCWKNAFADFKYSVTYLPYYQIFFNDVYTYVAYFTTFENLWF